MGEDPVAREVELPGQDVESVDLEPTIEPEPGVPAPDGDKAGDGAVSGAVAREPDTANSDPELGNTLIQSDNS